MKKILPFVVLAATLYAACSSTQVQKTLGAILSVATTPSEGEISQGLTESLLAGVRTGLSTLSQTDGFLNNQLVKIPFPEEAAAIANTLNKIGMQKEVDKVTTSLNRAAEKASGVALDVFVQSIQQMTIQDATNILLSKDSVAATNYLRKTSTPILIEKFRPIIETSLKEVNATKYWGDVASLYNKVPFVKPVNADLTGFVTERALQGVYLMIAKEEQAIRKDPLHRTSEMLKKVFGYADTKK